MKTHGVRASRRPGQRRGGEPCPGPRADDCVPEVLVGVGLRFGPVVGGVLGAVVYDEFIGPATATAADENRPAADRG
jgi:hypothetical protein